MALFSTNPGEISDLSSMKAEDIFNNSVVSIFNDLDANSARLASQSQELDQQNLLRTEEANSIVAGLLSERRSQLPSQNNIIMPQEEDVDYGVPIVDEPLVGNIAPAVGRTSTGKDPVDFIFNSEARRGADGKLKVYAPPSGDGGGSFEVAGITARYQPKEAARLRSLIEAGKSDEAEIEAKEFYRKRAAPFIQYTDNPGIQLQLADTVHHRGEGGLRRILQRATGSKTKDYGELIQTLSAKDNALDLFNEARQNYEWEEVDRGRGSRAKFRKGLMNRFKNADNAARQF